MSSPAARTQPTITTRTSADHVSLDRHLLRTLLVIARRGCRTEHDAGAVADAQLIARTEGTPR